VDRDLQHLPRLGERHRLPIIQDLPSLLWVINLGCIDLNPWYARCDDTDRPDYLHFDLDPVPKASFEPGDRDRAPRAARARGPGHGVPREDDRFEGHPCLRPHQARAAPEGSLDVCEEPRDWARGTRAEAGDRRNTGSPSARRTTFSWITTRTPGGAR
jgi:hypothetical protein